MKQNNILLIVLLGLISATTIQSRCSKRFDCSQIVYSFQTNIKAFPYLDSVNINDTIWIDFSCPTKLIDMISGQLVDYRDAENLGTDISFLEFTGGSVLNPGGIAAVDAFEFRLIYGVFVPDNHLPNQNKDYKFIKNGNDYRFKLGIIPKRSGIFTFSPGNAANVYTMKNKCDKAGFSITFANTNQHLYFYEQTRPGYTPSEYEQTHMYCFKVK